MVTNSWKLGYTFGLYSEKLKHKGTFDTLIDATKTLYTFWLAFIMTVFCSITQNAPAQEIKLSKDTRFNNYNTKNNFVSVYFKCVIRSKKGYIWVAGNGLYRFDGKKYVYYKAFENEHHQLKEVYVTDILEDRQGRIWLSGGSLSYYDEQQDRFRNIDIDTTNKINVAFGLCATGDKLWFTSNTGLYNIDVATLKPKSTSLKSNPDYPYNSAIDSNTIIHSGYSTHYYVYHIDKDKYDSVFISKTAKIFVSSVIKAGGKLWFGTSDGLWCADNITDEPKQIKSTERLGIYKLITVPAITGDSLLLIGTDKNGLLVYNIRQEKIEFSFTHDANNPYSLPGNEVLGMFADRNNILWICTNNGLCSIDGTNQFYKERLLPDQNPTKLVQDKYDRNIVWLSIHQKGILKIDWSRKCVVGFYPLSKIAGHDELGEGIYDMLQIDKHRWLFLGQPCLVLWNSNIGTGRVLSDFPLAKTHRGLRLRFIIPYNKDSCFITGNNGLFLFHIPAGKIDTAIVRHNMNTYSDCDLMSGVYDNKRTLWIASRNGLVSYNILTGKRKTYMVNEGITLSNYLTDAAVTKAGKIIFVSGAGIGVLDTLTEKISFFEKFKNTKLWGGAISIVDSIAWISSTPGIMHLNLNTWAPDFTTPSSEGDNFSNFAFGKVNDEFVWLTRNRYIYFKPSLLAKEALPLQTIIEKVIINKKPWYYPTGSLTTLLKYEQNSINFYFTAFEFNNPNGIQFRYKLEGLDKDWNFSEGQREANYIHIPPGKYTFVVESGNKDDVWNTTPATLSFEIIPPYWQTWWFRLTIVFSFIGLVVGIAAIRIRIIKKREFEKTEANKVIAEMELKALRSQMNPHFIFNSLNSIQKFIWENKQEDASEYLIKFSRLIRQILDNSMSKLITLEQELTTLSLYIELEHRRSNNKFDYRINVGDDLDTAHILVPSLILQPYVENAIWHGLLHKDGRGTLEVSILHNRELKEIQYIIEDNGIGRKKSLELRTKKTPSYGTQITEQRLAIPDSCGRYSRVKVEDKYDEFGIAKGTRIVINIPITDFIKI